VLRQAGRAGAVLYGSRRTALSSSAPSLNRGGRPAAAAAAAAARAAGCMHRMSRLLARTRRRAAGIHCCDHVGMQRARRVRVWLAAGWLHAAACT
jgi:hypothetical protein